MCKGCSLEIGNGFRGAVVRQDGIEKPSTWLASVNAAYLGEYLDRNTAMARVEKDIEPNMEMVLHDWGTRPARTKKFNGQPRNFERL